MFSSCEFCIKLNTIHCDRVFFDLTARDDGSFSGESRSGVKISLRQVQLATNNLSATNFIGQGVAGKVYKGILSDGQLVAVKHIVNDGQMETFIREVTSLSHVKHPNLVKLIGHCDGEDESFLVYELCDNGNLSEWLFGILFTSHFPFYTHNKCFFSHIL